MMVGLKISTKLLTHEDEDEARTEALIQVKMNLH